jgi:hypothetical protein
MMKQRRNAEKDNYRSFLSCDGKRRHDAQHNDTQHDDTQHNDTQHDDTQHTTLRMLMHI